jgi:hypothetical protein
MGKASVKQSTRRLHWSKSKIVLQAQFCRRDAKGCQQRGLAPGMKCTFVIREDVGNTCVCYAVAKTLRGTEESADPLRRRRRLTVSKKLASSARRGGILEKV